MLNRTNYESTIIDYLDGKLSPLEVAELLLFMEQLPDIKASFKGLEQGIFLAKDFTVFPNKELLKKALNSNELNAQSGLQNLLIAKLEGDLTAEEADKLNKQLKQDPLLRRDFERFENTKLQADTALIFKEKQLLKKKSKIIPFYFKYAAAAALIAAVIALPFFLPLNKVENRIPLEANENRIPQQIKKERTLLQPPQAFTKQVSCKNSVVTITKASTLKKNQLPVLDTLLNTPNIPPAPIETQIAEELTAEAGEEHYPPSTAESSSVTEPLAESTTKKSGNFLSVKGFVKKRIKDLTKENVEETKGRISKTDEEALTGWDLAALAARVFSKTSGKKVKLQKQYNEQGELKQYAIVSNNFEFSKSK